MSVIVYSRLGDVLRNRNLTVGELRQRIAVRFELAVDARTLDRLARAGRVRRPNLEIAAAAADVVGVGLDDLFAVETTSVGGGGSSTTRLGGVEDDVLDPDRSRRLEDLFEAQDWRTLTSDERDDVVNVELADRRVQAVFAGVVGPQPHDSPHEAVVGAVLPPALQSLPCIDRIPDASSSRCLPCLLWRVPRRRRRKMPRRGQCR